MRRALATLPVLLLSLVLLAGPASATESTPRPPAEGFGAGMWDGLLLAAVFGVIMGVLLFLDAYAGAPDDDHDASH